MKSCLLSIAIHVQIIESSKTNTANNPHNTRFWHLRKWVPCSSKKKINNKHQEYSIGKELIGVGRGETEEIIWGQIEMKNEARKVVT